GAVAQRLGGVVGAPEPPPIRLRGTSPRGGVAPSRPQRSHPEQPLTRSRAHTLLPALTAGPASGASSPARCRRRGRGRRPGGPSRAPASSPPPPPAGGSC